MNEIYDKYFIYDINDPSIPFHFNDKILIYFDTIGSATDFIQKLCNLWNYPNGINEVFYSKQDLRVFNEVSYNCTNTYPTFIEVRYSDDEDWFEEIHLFDKNTNSYII